MSRTLFAALPALLVLAGCARDPHLAALLEDPVSTLNVANGELTSHHNTSAQGRITILLTEARHAKVVRSFRPVAFGSIDDLFDEVVARIRNFGWDLEMADATITRSAAARRAGPGPPGPEQMEVIVQVTNYDGPRVQVRLRGW